MILVMFMSCFVKIYGFKLLYLFVLFFFYGDYTNFVIASHPWALHGGNWNNGVITGSFSFNHTPGGVLLAYGSRLVFTIL